MLPPALSLTMFSVSTCARMHECARSRAVRAQYVPKFMGMKHICIAHANCLCVYTLPPQPPPDRIRACTRALAHPLVPTHTRTHTQNPHKIRRGSC